MRMEPNLWRAGGVREGGEERVGSGRNREKLGNIAQYFAIEKAQTGWSQQRQFGNRY